MKPTVGRIVHYTTERGTTRPAIIVHVWTDVCVQLQVFTDFSNDSEESDLVDGVDTGRVWKTSVSFSEQPKAGHWNWPPRV